MDRLICNSLGAIVFPRLTKFKEKDILSECFKFSDLNLGLAEAMEIPKATAQRLGKLDIAAFLHYFTMLIIDCTWFGLLLPSKDRFKPQCHLPFYLCPRHPVSFLHVKKLNKVDFMNGYYSKQNVNFSKRLCSRISWSSSLTCSDEL